MTEDKDPAHILVPDEIVDSIPKLYATEKEKDPIVHLKFFTPDSNFTWFLIEYDPNDRIAFGLVDGHEREMGYISIEELEQVRGPLGLQVERDLHWKPTPLSQVHSTLDQTPPSSFRDRIQPPQDTPDEEKGPKR